MLKNSIIVIGIVATLACVLVRCRAVPPETAQPLVRITTKYTPTPVKIDGKLDDEAWESAAVYSMAVSKDYSTKYSTPLKETMGTTMREGGEVRLSWDDDYLYAGVWFEDSDIVAEGKEDQMHHYNMGDVLEVFLKPEDKTWYWELYATPHGKKTHFFFPGRGRLGLPSAADYQCDLRVGAQCEGTLNKWEDRDNGWSAEMAVPVKALTARGEAWGVGSQWRLLVARYNYSRHLPMKELTAVPQLTMPNHHLLEDYAVIEFVK